MVYQWLGKRIENGYIRLTKSNIIFNIEKKRKKELRRKERKNFVYLE